MTPARLTARPTAGFAAAITLALGACNPTVQVQAPDKPIVINLNIKIEEEVRIRVEKEAEELISQNEDLF